MYKKAVFSVIFLIIFSLNAFSRDIEVYFTPSYKALDVLVDLINSSKKSIDIAMYDFTSRPLAQSIVSAKKRGISIRIVLDKKSNNPKENRYTKYLYLKNNGIDVRFAKPHRHWDRDGIMHNKFAVFDGNIVSSGSANWTASAFAMNDENIVIIHRFDIANVYEKEFEILWKKATQR